MDRLSRNFDNDEFDDFLGRTITLHFALYSRFSFCAQYFIYFGSYSEFFIWFVLGFFFFSSYSMFFLCRRVGIDNNRPAVPLHLHKVNLCIPCDLKGIFKPIDFKQLPGFQLAVCDNFVNKT